MSRSGDVPGAQSIYRAVDILEQFSEATPSLTVKEVATATGLTMSTAHRLTRALESRGLLTVDPDTKQYRLGPTIARMASPIFSQSGVTSAVSPALRYLQHETREAVSFQVRLGYSRLCVLEYESQHNLQYKSGMGQSYPLVAGSAGKALIAHLTNQEVAQVVAEANASERWLLQPRDLNSLMKELQFVRKQGFATSAGEVRSDGAGVAAAVLDVGGLPFGVINVGGPRERFSEAVRNQVGKIVYAACLEVERSLGLPPRTQRTSSADGGAKVGKGSADTESSAE